VTRFDASQLHVPLFIRKLFQYFNQTVVVLLAPHRQANQVASFHVVFPATVGNEDIPLYQLLGQFGGRVLARHLAKEIVCL